MTILASYSEIALKSRYVRNKLERILANQIRFVLEQKGFKDIQIERRFGRLYIEAPNEAAIHIAKVFGIVSAMPAVRGDSSIDTIVEEAVRVATQEMNESETFAVRPRVIGKHEYRSRDIANKAGSAILESLANKNISVNLNEPDLTIHIEVRDRDSFVYTNIVKGFAGLPYGSQGRLVSLFSGGIDSPISTWLMMKRGAEILPLFMDQRPYVGESYIERVEQAYKILREYAPVKKFFLYFAPIEEIMTRIIESSNPRYNCVLCKRSMYRIAEEFASNNKARGIVTGESLGQVASQTLENLYVLDNVTSLPVFRPNIGLDKVEIEEISRKAGLYEKTARKVEGCTVVPDKPSTRSNLEKIENLEEELGLIKLCRIATKKVEIHDLN